MGSRKKKLTQVNVQKKFLRWYKSLSLGQRISFKQAIYCYGRHRYSLQEWISIMSRAEFFNPLYHNNLVVDGYSWFKA